MSKKSLSKKIFVGGFWLFSLKIVSQIFILIRVTVLARILSPTDFGLVGVALLAITMLYTLAQTGTGEALIQKKESIEDHFDTFWIISICRGFFLFILLFLGAPLVAEFFNNQQVIPIIKTLAFSPLILGFNSPRTINSQKEFQFNKQFILESSALIVDMTVAITCALILKNYWAIVWGYLAGNITRFIVSNIMFPHKPKFTNFDINQAKSMFHFGKWVFASGIISYIVSYGDNIFVGKVLGIAVLGLYQVAFRFSNLMATELTNTIGTVLFPAYSKIQDNLPKIQDAFSKTLELIAFFSLPIAAGMFFLAHDLVFVVLGEKWMAMLPTFRILIIAGLIRSFVAIGNPLFMGIGKPNLGFHIILLRLTFMALMIFPLSKYFGMDGVALSVLLSIILSFIAWYRATLKITKLTPVLVINPLIVPSISTLVMVLTILFMKIFINNMNTIKFVLVGLTSGAVYFIFSYLFWRKYRFGPIQTLLKLKASV